MREPRQHLPIDPAYKDVRFTSVDKKRWRKDNEKYFGYQRVKPGQLGQPNYEATVFPFHRDFYSHPPDLTLCPVRPFTKRQLWKEARRYWICHHRPCPDKKCEDVIIRIAEQHEREAGRDARFWRKGSHQAFNDTGADTWWYEQQGIDDADYALDREYNLRSIPGCDCPHCAAWPPDDDAPPRTATLAPLVDAAMDKREKKRRRAMKKLGWTDAAEELDIGYAGDEWMDLVIDRLEIDALSEFELV
jgi:hypothetical protein